MAKGNATSTSSEGVIPEAVLDLVNTTLRFLKQLKPHFLELVTLMKDPDILSQMHPLQRAQAYFLLAKATSTLLAARLRCTGVDLDKNPINSELERLSVYETKLKRLRDLSKAPHRPSAALNQRAPSKLSLWIILKNVPLEYCHFDAIQYIVSSLGTPLKIDESYNLRYGTRVQVELDATDPLRRSLCLIGEEGKKFEVRVEYEFFPLQCANCKVFGHDVQHCPKEKSARLAVGPETREGRNCQELYWRRGVKNGEGCEVVKSDRLTDVLAGEVVKESLKAVNVPMLEEEEDIEVVESTLQEGAIREDLVSGIPVIGNVCQILGNDEIMDRSSSMETASESSAGILVTPQDRFPEILGCCKVANEASMNTTSDDPDECASSPSLAAMEMTAYGARAAPLEFKDLFSVVPGGDTSIGGPLEDHFNSIASDLADGTLGKAINLENEMEEPRNMPRTRKDTIRREAVYTKKGRKPCLFLIMNFVALNVWGFNDQYMYLRRAGWLIDFVLA